MKKKIKSIFGAIISLATCSVLFFATPATANAQSHSATDILNYKMVVEAYDWGPGVSALIIASDEVISFEDISPDNFEVSVLKQSSDVDEPQMEYRTVVDAFISDADGNRVADESHFITLELLVHPSLPISNPFFETIRFNPTSFLTGNNWAYPYMHNITWNGQKFVGNQTERILPGVLDNFSLDGEFEYDDITLQYAYHVPLQAQSSDRPLIIWLHGGGEGSFENTVGTEIALLGNRATRLAELEIQNIMGGAHILIPQTPTAWLNGSGLWPVPQITMQPPNANPSSIYEDALTALIKNYIANTPNIDTNRIYIGGISNGGYMGMRMLFANPDLFAAAFPASMGYEESWIIPEELARVTHIPIWIIHDTWDSIAANPIYSIAMYEALISAGAENVRLTLTDGFFSEGIYQLDADGDIIEDELFRHDPHWTVIPVMNNDIRLITTDYNNLNFVDVHPIFPFFPMRAIDVPFIAPAGVTDAVVNVPAETSLFEWLAMQTLSEPDQASSFTFEVEMQTPSEPDQTSRFRFEVDNETGMIPLRSIAESLYAEVDWKEDSREVIITIGNDVFHLQIDASLPNNLGRAAIIGNRVFVPRDYISYIFDATMECRESEGVIYIDVVTPHTTSIEA